MTIVDMIFFNCVALLGWLATTLNVTYQAINVMIFVCLWPGITIIMICIILWQLQQIRKLRRELEYEQSDGLLDRYGA